MAKQEKLVTQGADGEQQLTDEMRAIANKYIIDVRALDSRNARVYDENNLGDIRDIKAKIEHFERMAALRPAVIGTDPQPASPVIQARSLLQRFSTLELFGAQNKKQQPQQNGAIKKRRSSI